MALTTRTLHGQILNPVTNVPAVGTITFKILQPLRDGVGNIIYGEHTFAVTLDGTGQFSIVLPVTDNPDVSPINWTYWVYVDTDVWTELFYMPLPSDMGDPVEFADLLPIVNSGMGCTPDGSACAPSSVVGDIAALQAQIDAIEADIAGFQAQIDAIQALVDGLDTEVADLSNQIAALTILVNTLQGQLNALTTSVGIIASDVVDLQADVTAIQAQITTINGQITTLQSQVATLQTDLTNLTTRVTTLEGNAVLKNPTAAGVYVGNQVIGPQAVGTTQWVSNQANPIPYSPGDTNADFLRIYALDEFGNLVQTTTWNGNAEGRDRPSARNRVARRTFESAEAVGFSTAQFWQVSSNPTVAANREPYLGVWGTASSKPGWAEATRVLSGLAGVSIGGTVNAALAPYNTLSAFNYRGLKTTPGAPAAGTWQLNDVVLDSIGVVWRCTVAGTPGTWVAAVNGTPLAVSFTAPAGNAATISDGTGTGAPYALTTTLNAADNRVVFDGAVANNGGVAITGGTVLFTVNALHAPAAWVQCNERTSTTLSARVTVRPDGTVRIDQSLGAGATVSLDGFNYRKS